MEGKHPKRISSLFSLGSSSSDKSSSTASRSQSVLNAFRPSRTPSPTKQLKLLTSGISSPTPPQTRWSPRNGESSAHTPKPRSVHLLASPEGLSAPPEDGILSPPPQITKLLPDLPGSFTGHISSNDVENKPESRNEGSSGSRPGSPIKYLHPFAGSELRLSKRMSWMPGNSHTDSQKEETGILKTQAWIVSPKAKIAYDVSPLTSFQQVHELWDEGSNALVYLHSGSPGKGPSFKLSSTTFASSRKLSFVAHGSSRSSDGMRPRHGRSLSSQERDTSRGVSPNSPSRSHSGSKGGFIGNPNSHRSLSPSRSPSKSPSIGLSATGSFQGLRAVTEMYDLTGEIHLHVPLPLQADIANPQSIPTSNDIETLVAIRNMFAFLLGRSLVATSRHPSIFSIFLRIADLLHRYEFTNLDGSSLGEEAATNFTRYVEDFELADVRNNLEKTIEAIIIGERMRSLDLYNEAFVHGVGKYRDILRLQSPKFHLITENTRKRMERATIDLGTRLKTVRARLEGFEFPSLFSGIAQSTTSTESKMVRFKAWRTAFMSMRKHVMSFYGHQYGAWPPNAKSKKNNFEESGLNRILLLELYQDFSDLYDVLVDRTALTTRTGELDFAESPMEVDLQACVSALRRVLGEFDQSSPPVQPPVPFDTPRLPSLATTRRDYCILDDRRQRKENSKKLRDDEINQALMQSYNRDSVKSTTFLQAFMSYERKAAHGKSVDEMTDLRYGQWMFMYAVLQSLPLVVIDAPGIRWTSGVEYFLCEVPKGAAPWYQEDQNRKMGWYGIAGGLGVVSLPAELVEHGVEGIFRRSHCWTVAEKWTVYNDLEPQPELEDSLSNLELPPDLPFSSDTIDSRSNSPARRSQRDSVHLGLEALPLPMGVVPSGAKLTSNHDPSRKFEDILGQVDTQKIKRK